MTFEELAILYADMNVYNPATRKAIIGIGTLFCERGVRSTKNFTLNSVIEFKRNTLSSAKAITFNGYLRYLRLIGDFGVEHGFLEHNYFRKLKQASIAEPAPKIIEDTSLLNAMRYLEQHQESFNPAWFWRSVILTLFWTGMRRRQLVNLKLSDINFSEGLIRLRKESSKTQREWVIPLHPALQEELMMYLDNCYRYHGVKLKEYDFLFNANRYNKKYSCDPLNPKMMAATSVTGFFTRLSRDSGIKVGAHRFRHTIATKMCNPTSALSPDIFSVQSFLGHKSLGTTRMYVSTPVERIRMSLDEVEFPKAKKKLDPKYTADKNSEVL